MAEQVDEYVDIGDEMPTATYQSMEIEKDAEGATGSGGSGSGSSSSSGMIKPALCIPSRIPKILQGADFLHLLLPSFSGSESRSSGDSASGAGNAILWLRGGC